MSAVHRIDDIWSMPAQKFFRFAWRLASYRGAVRERRIREQQEAEDDSPAPLPQQQQYEPPGYAREHRGGPQPGTRTLIENNPMFNQLIGFS